MIKLKRAIKIHSGYVITDTKIQTHLIQVKVGKYTFHFKLLRRVQWHGIHVKCFSICVWAIGRVSTKIFATKTENYFLKNLKKLKIFLPDGRIKLLRYFIARWKLELFDARGPLMAFLVCFVRTRDVSYFSYRHLFFFFFQVFTYLGIRIDLLQYTSGSSINVGTAPNIHSRKRAKRHFGILVVLRAWAWCAIRVSVCDFISCFKRILLRQVSLLQLSENGRRLVWRGITFNCLLVGHKLSSIHLSRHIQEKKKHYRLCVCHLLLQLTI